MASGNSLGFWDALAQRPRIGAGTPPTYSLSSDDVVLSFDTAADNLTTFAGILPSNYGGGNLTVRLVWMTDDAGTPGGNVKWDVAIERRQPTVYEIDNGPMFGTATSHTIAAAADFIIAETDFTITAANAGTPVAGEPFRISVKRDTGVGSNYDEAAFVLQVELVEA